MEKKRKNTREQLLFAAGELFAEFGYDAVSTRMIADRAEVKLGSIHYHFGSKENLFLEACRYAIAEKRCNGFFEVLAENPHLAEQPAGQAEIIRTAVYRNFHEFFRPEKPRWERRILIREVMNPSSAMHIIAEQIFKPDSEETRAFYRKIRPGASDREANAWMDILHSQIVFYAATEEMMVEVRNEKITDCGFYRQAARNVSRAMILLLELPLPEDLKDIHNAG